jgi:hypothetical protein
LFFAALGLDRVPGFRRDVRPAEPCHGADAGRRDQIDFGEMAVDAGKDIINSPRAFSVPIESERKLYVLF